MALKYRKDNVKNKNNNYTKITSHEMKVNIMKVCHHNRCNNHNNGKIIYKCLNSFTEWHDFEELDKELHKYIPLYGNTIYH